MLSDWIGRVPYVGLVGIALLTAAGCRTSQQPLTNPLAADRVPAPATRVIQPGTAQPYYPGDALPATGQFVAPPQTFGTPTVTPQPTFGAAAPPAAFGQAQAPVMQAQPFTAQPYAAPQQTFAQPPAQPFAQPLTPGATTTPPISTPATQPFSPAPISPAPFNPQPIPQGSGARFAPTPSGGAFTASTVSPAGFDDGGPVAIPSDDQSVRPAVSEQFLAAAPTNTQPAGNFAAPASAPASGLGQPANHVAVTMTPLSPPAGTQPPTGPDFSALPNAAQLPWISGSAPRTLSPVVPPQPVVQTGAFLPATVAAPAPRVRLPGGQSGAVQVTELPASSDGFRAR